MKHTIHILTVSILSLLFLLSSCSDSWLQTAPTDSTDTSDMFASVENAKQALNGICKLMSRQHARYGQGFNGEGTIMMMYGEYMGRDFQFPEFAPGWAPIINGLYTQRSDTQYDDYPWYYYYMIIGNANTYLENIDNAAGDEQVRLFLKAEALTFRAYAYLMLVQFYADSWADSNNGAADGVVLRLNSSMDGEKISSLSACYERIYKDLDDAIELYKKADLKRSDVFDSSAACFPDIYVAYAVYARAALTKEDYQTALEKARLAEEGSSLMSVADYRAGFVAPSSEWIWGSYNDPTEQLYYWSWQVTMAYNGYYADAEGGTVASRELIDAVPATDIRKGLFVYKETFCDNGDVNDLILTTGYGNFSNTDAGKAAQKKANAYAQSVCAYKPATVIYPYTNLKFACTALPGVGCVPFIRTSEMLLIEAEALCRLNNDSEAQKVLLALNRDSGRDAAYACTKTGADLLEEVKFYRRLELWGEGRSWFDQKRWGGTFRRNGFDEGGNFHASITGTFGDVNTFWKWAIPKRESDYNDQMK
ncbi:MAG: RagB/SusD family nutrient uptake outer membrane protein [Prevotellaceae bacterium]|jgi:hypothetical protein|nr:RagB/SusD family nutrient uptake outer membrane protein [Prevotellaceae bacterium]